ncbi:thioesterase family protein [Panacibacter sp. DH6]|uniref:Thioesterase family protein n=1 Tax=Panacibacter microcysteis TaxID=2793269 RepID=A0A931E9Q1_9BACT|nr:thioesterase family protein [Panacibacter microcysteis]MBG9377768.1 thioesterase family protein [Panacibacter microcysteis]
MSSYIKQVDIRWSDMDPNFHLRHSVYYDWGAMMRLSFLHDHGLTPAVMQQLHFGPILFREECVFKREILFGDTVFLNVYISKSRRDMSRWSMIHEVWKNKDILSATITVDGAWLDTQSRKLATPPAVIKTVFEALPKSPGFEWTD